MNFGQHSDETYTMAQASGDEFSFGNCETDTSYRSLDERLSKIQVQHTLPAPPTNYRSDAASDWFSQREAEDHEEDELEDAGTVRRVNTTVSLIPKSLLGNQQQQDPGCNVISSSSDTAAAASLEIPKSKPKPRLFPLIGGSIRELAKSVHLTAGLLRNDAENTVIVHAAVSEIAVISPPAVRKEKPVSGIVPPTSIDRNSSRVRPAVETLAAVAGPSTSSKLLETKPEQQKPRRIIRINGLVMTNTALMQRRGAGRTQTSRQQPVPQQHHASSVVLQQVAASEQAEIPVANSIFGAFVDVIPAAENASDERHSKSSVVTVVNCSIRQSSRVLPTPSASSSSNGASPKRVSEVEDNEESGPQSGVDGIYWRQKQWMEKREQRLRNQKQAASVGENKRMPPQNVRSRQREVVAVPSAPPALHVEPNRMQDRGKHPKMAFGRPLTDERKRSRSVAARATAAQQGSDSAPVVKVPVQPVIAPNVKRQCTIPVEFNFAARDRQLKINKAVRQETNPKIRLVAAHSRPVSVPAHTRAAAPASASVLNVAEKALAHKPATIVKPFKFATDTRIEERHKKEHDVPLIPSTSVALATTSSRIVLPPPPPSNKHLIKIVKSNKPLTKPYSPKFVIEKRLRQKREAAEAKKAQHDAEAIVFLDEVRGGGRSRQQQGGRAVSRRSRSACEIAPARIIIARPAPNQRPATSAANMTAAEPCVAVATTVQSSREQLLINI